MAAKSVPIPQPVLKVRIRDVYGIVKYYPVNDAAKVFADIARTKTLTLDTIECAKRLGYVVESEQREVA